MQPYRPIGSYRPFLQDVWVGAKVHVRAVRRFTLSHAEGSQAFFLLFSAQSWSRRTCRKGVLHPPPPMQPCPAEAHIRAESPVINGTAPRTRNNHVPRFAVQLGCFRAGRGDQHIPPHAVQYHLRNWSLKSRMMPAWAWALAVKEWRHGWHDMELRVPWIEKNESEPETAEKSHRHPKTCCINCWARWAHV